MDGFIAAIVLAFYIIVLFYLVCKYKIIMKILFLLLSVLWLALLEMIKFLRKIL